MRDGNILIRAEKSEIERWKLRAKERETTLSDLVRDFLNGLSAAEPAKPKKDTPSKTEPTKLAHKLGCSCFMCKGGK